MTDQEHDPIEDEPMFIASQLRVGHVLTEKDVAAIQAVVSEADKRENEIVEAHHDGRMQAFREVGGDELVTAVELKQSEEIAVMVRRHMDRLFPKEQRKLQ